MMLQINANYRITTDDNNVIVEVRKIAGEKSKNPGEERWEPSSFHRTLEQACLWIFDQGIYKSSDLDVNALQRTMTQLKNDIVNAIRTIKL